MEGALTSLPVRSRADLSQKTDRNQEKPDVRCIASHCGCLKFYSKRFRQGVGGNCFSYSFFGRSGLRRTKRVADFVPFKVCGS